MQAVIQELLTRYGGWVGTILLGLAVYYFLALSWDDDGKGGMEMVEETELSLCAYLAGLRRELGRMLDFCRECMEAWDTAGVRESNTRSAPFVLAQGRCHRCWQQKAIERQIAEIERVQPAARQERLRVRKAAGWK